MKVWLDQFTSAAYQQMLDDGLIENEGVVQHFIGVALKTRNPKEIYKRMADYMDNAEKDWRLDPGYSIDCKTGCNYCCHLNVDIFDHEAIAIRDHLKARYSKEEISKIKERAYGKYVVTNELDTSDRQQLRIPCPLLSEKGTCMAYDARPLPCRKFYSADVSYCKHGYEHPEERHAKNPFWRDPFKMGGDIEAGLTLGFAAKIGFKAHDKIKSMEEHLVKKL